MLKKSLAGLVVVLAIALLAVYFIGGMVISKVAVAGVEAFVPKVTGTEVSMGGLSVSPLTGSGEVKNFVLGNPEGFQSDHSIAFGRAHIEVDPLSVLGDRILIKKIHIFEPRFTYERKLLTSNINQILKTIKAASGRTVNEGDNLPEAVEGAGIRIEIKELIISKSQISLAMAGATVLIPVPVPEIVFRDLGKEAGGIPPDEMIFEIMSVVLPKVLETVAKAPGGAVKDAAKNIEHFFGGEN